MRKTIVFLAMCGFSLFCFYCISYAEPFEGKVLSRNGKSIVITDLKVRRYSNCEWSKKNFPNRFSFGNSDERTETDFLWDFVPIFDGTIVLNVPLKTIKTISMTEMNEDDQKLYDTKHRVDIELGNGTKVSGVIWGLGVSFMGYTDIGKMEFSQGGLQSIVRTNDAADSNELKSISDIDAVLTIPDDSEISLHGVRFVEQNRTEYHCFAGFDYKDSLSFTMDDGGTVNLSFDKVARFAFPDQSEYRESDVCSELYIRAYSKSSNDYFMKLQYPCGDGHPGIFGTTQIGDYNIEATIPFCNFCEQKAEMNFE